jgi:hypothetical protein
MAKSINAGERGAGIDCVGVGIPFMETVTTGDEFAIGSPDALERGNKEELEGDRNPV